MIDVYNNKNTLDEFIGQLSNKDLTDLCRGEGFLNSKLGVKGNAGVFGGYTKRLQYFGVPVCVCCDGPAGLRIEGKSTNLPSETLIASTFNEELVYECFKKLGKEMVEVGCDAFLAPGMNIHRHPLNGRNFEYYSEDPLLTGIMGSSTVKGVQENLISACPKHFACNNQEYGRRINNSIVSERALREIYTKGFEFVIKNSKPYNIMTSYNRINGVWSHYNYDLVTTLLRKEWGYTGNVMTDWFMKLQRSKEFPKIKNNSYRVRSGVDVLMPGGKTYLEIKYRYDWAQLKSLGEEDGITIGEYQECSKHVLKFLMNKFKYTEYNK